MKTSHYYPKKKKMHLRSSLQYWLSYITKESNSTFFLSHFRHHNSWLKMMFFIWDACKLCFDKHDLCIKHLFILTSFSTVNNDDIFAWIDLFLRHIIKWMVGYPVMVGYWCLIVKNQSLLNWYIVNDLLRNKTLPIISCVGIINLIKVRWTFFFFLKSYVTVQN